MTNAQFVSEIATNPQMSELAALISNAGMTAASRREARAEVALPAWVAETAWTQGIDKVRMSAAAMFVAGND